MVDIEWEDGVMIARTAGRIDSANARDFGDRLATAMGEDGCDAVLMDFASLTYISSAGLRVILLVARKQERQNGKFGICSLADPIREIFAISGFDRIIAIYPSRTKALAALST